MSRRWALVIIFSVLTVVVWSTWEVYKSFSTQKDVGNYEVYVIPIDPSLDTDLISKIYDLQDRVLVKEKDIQPK